MLAVIGDSQNLASINLHRRAGFEDVGVMKAAGSVRPRMPEGFCPPFRCHSGIMADRTMHHANAIFTHIRSALWAGFHQMPCGATMAVCSVSGSLMAGSTSAG